ncbi:zinc finger protein 117 [Drosophila takahashii]|uniref:zinc finger protein 117 n=1 Tax=Drosophila takahashii TaxID=29030 RepID=UPI001CF8B4D1|nr:zinc finger protein 85 [Drosophila takahashii]
MSWPGKLLTTYKDFTADLPALQIDKKTEGCAGFCNCKCKCCRGFAEKYVAFNGENVLGSEFPNQFSEGDDIQKIMRFRSSDMLLLLQAAQLRDNFWSNQYFKADLQEDYQAILDAFKDRNRKVQLETLGDILDTVTTGYRRAVSQLTGQEAQGALRPKFAAIILPGFRCVCHKCEHLPWKKLQDVEDHQRIHRYSDNFHCQICYRRFYLQHSLTSHLSRKTGITSNPEDLYENERYKRLLEKQKSREREELQISADTVEDIVVQVPKNIECYFRKERTLPVQKRKTSVHTKCPLCDQKYSFSFSHQLHMVKHRRHRLKPKLFPCSYCFRTFLTRKFLRKHQSRVRTSSNLLYRPFKCRNCPRRFQLWSTLKTHIIQIHTRKNLCLICQLPTLSRCCPAHTAKECREAVKKHREKQRLLRGPPRGGCKKKPKPKCEICEKDFANKFFLTEHLNKKHLNRRNFTCEICGANFYSQGTMQTHRKSVHLLKQTIKCEVCDLTIKSKGNYLRHLKSQSHKDNSLKLGKDHEKCEESTQSDNHINITMQSTTDMQDMETNSECTAIYKDGASRNENSEDRQLRSKTACRFQKPEKFTFCEPCGNSIVGNMQRHYKSTKHKRNLILYKKKDRRKC